MFFFRAVISSALVVISLQAGAQVIAVLSSKTGQPVTDAVVNIRSAESSKSVYLFTGAEGEVTNPFSGKCYVSIQHVLFLPYSDTIFQAKGKLQLYLVARDPELAPVVVTGQYNQSGSAYAVSKVKVIDQKRMERQAAFNLKDVLEQELNVRISQDNILGSAVSIQGVSGQNVKILLDGVPLTGREGGNIDLSQINLNNIERIEYIEGPMSVSYGSDALGGVINLISKKDVKGRFESGVKTYYGSVGQYNLDAFTGFSKKNNTFKLSGGRYFFGGYSPEDVDLRTQTWKPKEQLFGSILYGLKLKKKLEVKYTGDAFFEKITNRGLAVINPYEAYGFDDIYITNRIINKIFIDKRLKNNAQLQLINSHSLYRREKNTYHKDLVTLESVLTQNEADQDTTIFNTFNFRGSYSSNKITSKLNFQLGYDIVLENGKGEKMKGDNQSINDYAAFSSLEYNVTKKLMLRPGIRMAYNSRYGAPFVYSFNFKQNISSELVLRGSYAKGFRAPGLKELNLFFVDLNHNITGNQDLRAEHSHNFQSSLSWSKAKKDRIYKLEPSVFYNNIYNMISLALVEPATQLYTYVNTDRFTGFGASLGGEFKNKEWTFSAGYSYTGRNNRLISSDTATGNQYSSEYRANIVYSFTELNTEVSLFYKHNGKVTGYAIDAGSNIVPTEMAAYDFLDLILNWNAKKPKLGVSVGVKNILNIKNINFSGPGGVHAGNSGSIAAAMGRNYFVSFKYSISKK